MIHTIHVDDPDGKTESQSEAVYRTNVCGMLQMIVDQTVEIGTGQHNLASGQQTAQRQRAVPGTTEDDNENALSFVTLGSEAGTIGSDDDPRFHFGYRSDDEGDADAPDIDQELLQLSQDRR